MSSWSACCLVIIRCRHITHTHTKTATEFRCAKYRIYLSIGGVNSAAYNWYRVDQIQDCVCITYHKRPNITAFTVRIAVNETALSVCDNKPKIVTNNVFDCHQLTASQQSMTNDSPMTTASTAALFETKPCGKFSPHAISQSFIEKSRHEDSHSAVLTHMRDLSRSNLYNRSLTFARFDTHRNWSQKKTHVRIWWWNFFLFFAQNMFCFFSYSASCGTLPTSMTNWINSLIIRWHATYIYIVLRSKFAHVSRGNEIHSIHCLLCSLFYHVNMPKIRAAPTLTHTRT